MCLAIPGRLLDAEDLGELTATGRVDFGGVSKVVSLAFVPEVRIGDFVLVHAGIAIAVLDAAAAARILAELDAGGEAA
jgi:hydrogenase expression/formation protein HypC